jgi:hypothetical protein
MVICDWSRIPIIQMIDRCKVNRNGGCYKTTLTNMAVQAIHALNNTVTQFAAHSTTLQAAVLPVAAAFGFMPGLFGLKRG